MRIPFINIRFQHEPIRNEIYKAVRQVLDSQHFILNGFVQKFERAVAEYLGVKEAVAVASGSDALYLALLACGVGKGDEVITTPFTFFATAGAISRAGARPVFVDIDINTFNLNPALISSKITPKTKAVVPVHLYGLTCDMDRIREISQSNGLKIVEDAAQAFGAAIHGRKAGTIGDCGCLSFYPTKNLGCAGDGGMVITSSTAYAEKIKQLRDHGSVRKYIHESIGINSRLDEMQAAILLVKMKKIDEWNQDRACLASHLSEGLKDVPVQLPIIPSGYAHVFHLYSILAEQRDSLMRFLESRGIGAAVYYPLPLHLQPCYRNLGYKQGDFPEAEKASEKVLSLPMYVGMTSQEAGAVIQAVKEFYQKHA